MTADEMNRWLARNTKRMPLGYCNLGKRQIEAAEAYLVGRQPATRQALGYT